MAKKTKNTNKGKEEGHEYSKSEDRTFKILNAFIKHGTEEEKEWAKRGKAALEREYSSTYDFYKTRLAEDSSEMLKGLADKIKNEIPGTVWRLISGYFLPSPIPIPSP